VDAIGGDRDDWTVVKLASQGRFVSRNALIKRINRKLRWQNCLLRRTRGWRPRLDLGDYWIHNYDQNTAESIHVDIETLGRKLAVLRNSESVVPCKG
jgi:hypothetical protein